MRHFRPTAYMIVAVMHLLSSRSVYAQTLRYSVYDMGVLSNRTSSGALTLSEAGNYIVGDSNSNGAPLDTELPFFWSGSLDPLPLPSGTTWGSGSSVTFGDLSAPPGFTGGPTVGGFAGAQLDGNDARVVVWQWDGGPANAGPGWAVDDYGNLGGTARATGVCGNPTIAWYCGVGYSYTSVHSGISFDPHAVRFCRGTGLMDENDQVRNGADSTWYYGISPDCRFTVGSDYGSSTYRSFLLDEVSPGNRVRIEFAPAYASPYAAAVNIVGDVFGRVYDGSSTPCAIQRRSDGSLTVIGELRSSDTLCQPYAINYFDWAVGYSADSNDIQGTRHAFLYPGALPMLDLNDLVPSGSPTIVEASGIDVFGNISATIRTSSGDLHAAFLAQCGNGHADPGEECDEGGANGTGGSCCTTLCRFEPSSKLCNAASGECDLDHHCSGSSGECSTDNVKAADTPCADDGNPCSRDVCDGTQPTCQHPAGNTGATCNAGNGCRLPAQCDGTSTTCPATMKRPDGTSCSDGNACTTMDQCANGVCIGGPPPDCADNNGCTIDSCSPATGCLHDPVKSASGTPLTCDPTKSTEGVVGGPAGMCGGGQIVGGNCVLSNAQSHVTLTIPLAGPPYAINPPEPINIASVAPASCATDFVSLQIPGTKIASCIDLRRAASQQNQPFGVPLTLTMGWDNTGTGLHPDCDVATSSGTVPEGQLHVYRDGVAVTAECDPVRNCNGSPASQTCLNQGFCSTSLCSESLNTMTVSQVQHFSQYAFATPCHAAASTRLTVSRMGIPGKGRLSFSGLFTEPFPSVDPVAEGIQLILSDANGAALDVQLPGGAYWRVDSTGKRFTYVNLSDSPPGGINKASLDLRRAPSFKVKGRRGTYSAAASVVPQIVLGNPAQCYAGDFSHTAGCTILGPTNAAGATLRCR